MPFRKTYEINNREHGKAVQRDQSYRSCLIALIIFFFMCLILILASVPWKVRNWNEYKNEYEYEPQHHHHHEEHTREARTSTTNMTVPSTTSIIPIRTSASTTISTITPTEEDIETITENYLKKSIKEAGPFERYSENRTTVNDVVIISRAGYEEDADDNDITREEVLQSTQGGGKDVAATEDSVNLATLQFDNVTNDIVDDNASSTSIINTTTLKYNATIIDRIITRTFEENTTDKYSSDGYYNSSNSQFNVTADLTSTESSARTTDFQKDTIKMFTDGYSHSEKLGIDVTDNVRTSETSSQSSDLEESTIEFHVITDDIATSISPIRSTDFEQGRNAKNSTDEYLTSMESTTIGYNVVSVIRENSSREDTSSLDEDNVFSTGMENIEDTMNVTGVDQNENVTFDVSEKYNVSFTNYAYESTSVLSTTSDTKRSTTILVPINHETSSANQTILPNTLDTLPEVETGVCKTGRCKQIASKILSYMNHSADPCDDFYEYACGGFEADPQLIDRDLVRTSRNYQRIARQMLQDKRENEYSPFATYYDSCMQYEKMVNFSERVKLVNDALKKIGKFYTIDTRFDNNVDFTNLFVQLMLHHSALLFDVIPELDEYRPNSFTLKIGPTTYESPFETEHAENSCFEDKYETKEQYVNLGLLYDNYKRCKNDTTEYTQSVKETLITLNVFEGLNDSRVVSEHIEKTLHVINSVIIQGYFSNFPSKSEIREAYLMNNYSKVSIEELQNSSTFVNWTRLVRSLTGVNVVTSEAVQVYFHAALIKGFHRLEKFGEQDTAGLNNAIMGLYAHKLYHELVLSRRNNVKDHCLQVATHLLQLEASSLYISSFTDQEIAQMDRTIEELFNMLKRTLKLKTAEAEWAREEGRRGLLRKIDGLKFTVPVVSYLKNRDSLYNEYNISQIVLHNNYFNNSMTLMRRYRTLMYAQLTKQVGSPKQIWTYYATPFQSKARAIYGLNLIVIPYGIIDWPSLNEEFSFDYLLLATLGNLMAHQIAHHFDAIGIHYWNQTRNIQDSLMFENDFTETNFDDYINCQKENLYQGSINMLLPFTDQIVSFTIPRLTLNERLSEIMGLRLAYDTLALVRSDTEERLPWIELRIDQLFYVAYAQMYCTKSPLTSSYISLYENEDLPSRIRVFVSVSNNNLLAEAWSCPIGSQVAPNDICSVFPYIDFKEAYLSPV